MHLITIFKTLNPKGKPPILLGVQLDISNTQPGGSPASYVDADYLQCLQSVRTQPGHRQAPESA